MAKRVSAKSEVRELSLPEEPNEPKVGLTDFRWMIHGFPKSGKSSIASYFPNPIFLATEEGLNALEVYSQSINNWPEYGQMVEQLIEEDHEFETIVIDTLGQLYEYLKDQVSGEHNVDHVNDLGFGAGYDEANKRLHRTLEDLYHSGLGVVLISHSRYTDLKYGMRSVTKVVPDLSNSPRQVITGWVDNIIFFDVKEQERDEDNDFITSQFIAQCQPTPYVEAGGRLSKWMPDTISLGDGPQEGFQALEEAFENAASEFLESLSQD